MDKRVAELVQKSFWSICWVFKFPL
jgi:hypothetical protein